VTGISGPRAVRVQLVLAFLLLPLPVIASSCNSPDDGRDEKVTTWGSAEVTAELVEIRGKIQRDPLYNYAHVMKYRVLEVHRAEVGRDVIFVGHYNPYKPRPTVQDYNLDSMGEHVGGNLKKFRPGDIHRMALKVPIDEHFMGGVINKYFGGETGPIYWAVWTNRVINR